MFNKNRADLTGKLFNKLVVVGPDDDYVSPAGARQARWKCRCQCGNIVSSTSSNLNGDKIFSCGCEKRNKDKVCGIGIYDGETFNSKNTPIEYMLWHNMLHRCANEGLKNRCPTYLLVFCKEEWKTFSNFNIWFSKQTYVEGYHLDKDILVPGNKLYGPETACLIPGWLNSSLVTSYKRKEHPLGVTVASYKPKDKSLQRYVARLGQEFLGNSTDPFECHSLWQKAKLGQLLSYVGRYRKEDGYRVDVEKAIVDRADLLKHELDNKIETVRI